MPKNVTEIPSTVTIVDMKTGEETHQPMSWKVVPPPADCCQICGRKHPPNEPHDVQQIYYQVLFESMVGRGPTWADAVAHCSEAMKASWKEALLEKNAWTEPPAGENPVKHHGVDP